MPKTNLMGKSASREKSQSLEIRSVDNFKPISKPRFNANRLKELFQKNVITESVSPQRTETATLKDNYKGKRESLPKIAFTGIQKEKSTSEGAPNNSRNPRIDYNSKLLKTENRKCVTNAAITKLKVGKFRFLNEQMYTSSGKDSLKYFKDDPEAFTDYHNGFQQQVGKWPVNPIDLIINDIRDTCEKELVIADFGCGDAKIAQTFPERKVHSFDLKALNERVVECDISKVPLKKESVDIAVFCLSLMGINFHEYLIEAGRVLKAGGLLYIAEVISRFENQEDLFVKGLKGFGFKVLDQNWSNKMFGLIKLKKKKRNLNVKKVYSLKLSPCLYKKR